MASRFAIEPDYETDNALSLEPNTRDVVDDIERATYYHDVETEIAFWKQVNDLALDFPDVPIVVIAEGNS